MKLKSLLDFSERREMTKGESETFLMCSMSEQQNGPGLPEGKEEPQFASYQILSNRLEWAQVEVSFWVKLFLSTLCSSPGNCVLYAYACADIYHRQGRSVTMTELANAFPMGFPTDKALQDCWEAQKHPAKRIDNGYDRLEYWQAS